MFKKTEFKGYNVDKMNKDATKLTKQYLKSGKSQKEAEAASESLINYYKHTYRVFE
ncbi:hypothetical protein [Enterococcus sp. AZ196]|uniref:hypothetical protein n=1 Tax=Enterococcus sp. AZ196 TaxID=2774659 RepID=UPI003D2D0786